MTNLTSKEAKMGKVMRHTLGASLNIRHNLSSSKGPKPLQLKLLTTYIPKTSAFTLAFSTSQRLRTTRASARTFFTFRHYITPSARNFCLMVTVCPSQFATRRTLFHVLVGCGLLMLKVSRLKLPVIWLLVSMWLNTLTKSQIWTLLLKV